MRLSLLAPVFPHVLNYSLQVPFAELLQPCVYLRLDLVDSRIFVVTLFQKLPLVDGVPLFAELPIHLVEQLGVL